MKILSVIQEILLIILWLYLIINIARGKFNATCKKCGKKP